MNPLNARCADLSRAAGERLSATATTAWSWLLIEVPGTWPRDVSSGGVLPADAAQAVSSWLERTPRSRALFLRRPGRAASQTVAFVVRAEESVAETRRLELASHELLATVDFDADGELVEPQLVLVCGHGTRDACCALRGTAVYTALATLLGEEELWISSHHGGHRFAANVLVLPHGIHLGRVKPGNAPTITARALAGEIELEHYRGRTFYDSAVQAAEHVVRESTGLDRIGDLRLVGAEGSIVRFRSSDKKEHAAVVEETVGPPVPASCGAEPEAQKTFSARLG
jgi:hypothetical protein